MTEPIFKLKNPPIIEAVLDIDCDLPPNLKVATLETRARKEFKKSYPKFQQQFIQQHEIKKEPNEPPKVSVKDVGVQALQFLKNDGKQLIQFRTQGFSFNRLSPYTSLDDYLPQIKSAWTAYVKLASPVQVRLIRLRYINRILLPFVNEKVELEEYFRTGPRVADAARLTLLGFLSQYSAVDAETGNQINSVLTAQAPEGDKLPIIFDNSAMALEIGDPENWTWIRSKIVELRQLKNHIFSSTLTETCLNQFQQR